MSEDVTNEQFANDYRHIAQSLYPKRDLRDLRENIKEVEILYRGKISPNSPNFAKAEALADSLIKGTYGLAEAAVMIVGNHPIFADWSTPTGDSDETAIRYFLDIALGDAITLCEKQVREYDRVEAYEARQSLGYKLSKTSVDHYYSALQGYEKYQDQLRERVSTTPPSSRR